VENISIKWFVIGIVMFFVMGGLIGATIASSIYSRQLGQRDIELREFDERYRELESDYSDIRSSAATIIEDNRRWKELNGRAVLEIEAIGNTISQLQLQGISAAEQLQRVINALKEISRRIRSLEDYSNSVRNGNSD
jgi:DNA repair exonuclease SbcCD ATPase subunit